MIRGMSSSPVLRRITLETAMKTVFFSLLLLLVCYVDCAPVPLAICKVYERNESITIGGIFSLHGDLLTKENKVKKCGRLLPVSALQLTEAMAFAVDAVNEDSTLLPYNHLGFKIRDDCSRDEYAMWDSLSFLMRSRPTIDNGKCRIPGNAGRGTALTMGIVGPGRSSSSGVVTNVAQLFKRPMVSYGATEAHLQVVNSLSFHFSTISSDHHKAGAIVDVLSHFNWKYIVVVYSLDESVAALEEEVSTRLHYYEPHLCISKWESVHEPPSAEELNMVVDTLRSNQNAQVVLLLASDTKTVRAVLSAVSNVDPPVNRTWVVDSWGSELTRDGHSQTGISIEYYQPELVEFENYFRSRVSNRTNYNPWFEEFCKKTDFCIKSSRRGFSKSLVNLAPTIDAVFALAHFLDKIIRECHKRPLLPCLHKRNNTADYLLKRMQDVSFEGTRGHFRFNNNSVNAHFIIKHLQEVEGVLKLVEVGYWDPAAQDLNQLNLNSTLIHWGDGTGGQSPKSSCWTECLPNQVIEKHPRECCSGCRNCSGIVDGNKCTECDENKKPNENFTVCVDLDKKSITLNDPCAIVLISLASFGLLLCAVTSYGMIRHRHHALIKAASRELSAVNIIGLVLAFVSVFPFLVRPTAGICGVAQSLYTLSFTLMYAPLLLKVNRIYRIFESSSKTVKRPRFTGPISQLVIVAVLVTIQLVIILITALARPKTWDSVKTWPVEDPESEQKHLEIFCNLDTRFVAPMCYNIALLVVCCYYAYKARNVPGNFNEARFYVASVYTTLMPIVAAVPLYFTAQRANIIGVSITIMPITNGYVTLSLVYLSTLYAIIFNNVDKQDGKEPVVGPRPMRLSCLDDKRPSTSVGSSAVNKVHPMVTRVGLDEMSQTNSIRLDEDVNDVGDL